jgi:hypothetical protein
MKPRKRGSEEEFCVKMTGVDFPCLVFYFLVRLCL